MPDAPDPRDVLNDATEGLGAVVALLGECDDRKAEAYFEWVGPHHLLALLRPVHAQLLSSTAQLQDYHPRDWVPPLPRGRDAGPDFVVPRSL